LILAIGGAWFCDIGAYFAGTFFGKNKMAPGISPKKTWEGAIGGVASNIVLCLFVGLIWKIFFLSTAEHIQWLLLALYALISAVGSMFGDLVFSVIKRKCNIKDYGNIIPGHGGVLDRFDSVILTAPILYMFIQVFPLIIR
ncbi:MAG: CDP-archaeol synthase, partial [Clostridia bacterium]|nr:CDP-archaeol synthase [Clostridia bacterium]